MSESFWKERVKNFGHTGWADIVIYSFNQPNRVNSVHELINQNTPGGGVCVSLYSILDVGQVSLQRMN